MTRCIAKTKAGKLCRCSAVAGGTTCSNHVTGPVTEATAVRAADVARAAAMTPVERCRAGLCDHTKLDWMKKYSPCRDLCDRGLCDHGRMIPYAEWTGVYPMGMTPSMGSHGVWLKHYWEVWGLRR